MHHGSEGNQCYENGTCDPGLACLSGVCVKVSSKDAGGLDGAWVDAASLDSIQPDVGKIDIPHPDLKKPDISTPDICLPDKSSPDIPLPDHGTPDSPLPFCGDGIINGKEKCDGTQLGGQTCKGLGYDGGSLLCSASCQFNTISCYSCGDGKLNGPTEQCDKGSLGGKTCKSAGYYSGMLKCKKDCSLDYTGCTDCGNGVLNIGEQCDGNQFGNHTCQTQGFYTGTLLCKAGCLFDTSKCSNCGNGKVDKGEQCDGAQLGGKTCATLGFGGGSLACSQSCTHDTVNCQWAIAVGGGGAYDSGYAVAADSAGNSYITGDFWATGTFGKYKLVSKGGYDTYVAKLSPSGKVLWAKSFGGNGTYDDGMDLALDNSDNLYVAGYYSGTAVFGSTTLTVKGSKLNNAFVAKLDPSGKVQWATSLVFDQNCLNLSIAVDSSGNSYLTSEFYGTAQIGAYKLTSRGWDDILVVKLDAKGKVLWARSAGGPKDEMPRDVALDTSGNVYLTGDYGQAGNVNLAPAGVAAHFGSTTLKTKGGGDIFVARLSPSGTFQWAVTGGGPGLDYGEDIAVDKTGAVIISGGFGYCGTSCSPTKSASFGNISIKGTKSFFSSRFLAKLKPSGSYQWAKVIPGRNFALDASDNIYTAGWVVTTLTYCGSSLSSASGDHLLVARLSPSGSCQWVATASGATADDIAVDGKGSVYVTGDFDGPALFGSTLLTATMSAHKVFLWKIGPKGP